MREYHVAIVGATGAVGTEFLNLLEQREFPMASLRVLASERSVGRTVFFKGRPYPRGTADGSRLRGRGYCPVFSGRQAKYRICALAAVAAGALVIDNSSAFRMDSDVPLVIPEINPEDIVCPSRNHRESELLDDPSFDGVRTDSPPCPDSPRCGFHLSGGQRSRSASDSRTLGTDTGSAARPPHYAGNFPLPDCLQPLFAQHQD